MLKLLRIYELTRVVWVLTLCEFMSLQRQYGTEIAIAIEYQTFNELSTTPYVNVMRVGVLKSTTSYVNVMRVGVLKSTTPYVNVMRVRVPKSTTSYVNLLRASAHLSSIPLSFQNLLSRMSHFVWLFLFLVV